MATRGLTCVIGCRPIVDSPAPGPWNMAADEALLVDAAENGTATLRFYGWSEPTLSLGYFQRYEDRYAHAPSRECAVVRRQSGGGAILHDRELTYSLVLPAGHLHARHAGQLYSAVHDAMIAVLAPWIPGGDAKWALLRRREGSMLPPREEPFLCFERRACGDVLLIALQGKLAEHRIDGTHEKEFKILGSAQRRYRGAILQHGSLLVERSPAAPELAGFRDLTGAELPIPKLIDAVIVALRGILDVRFPRSGLPNELESKARHLANTKYGTPAWTKRR